MEQQIPFLSSSNWKGETNPTNKTPTKIQPKSAENVTTFRLPVLWLINLIFCSSKAINSCRFCLGKKHFPKKTQVKMWWNPSKVRLGRCHVLTSTRIRGPTVRLEDENCHGKNNFSAIICYLFTKYAGLVIFIVCIWRKDGDKWMGTHISHYSWGGHTGHTPVRMISNWYNMVTTCSSI